MEVNVTVNTPTPFDTLDSEDSILDITFTNIAGFTYAAGNIYYIAELTDSSDPPITQEVVFKVTEAVGGTVNPNTSKLFTIENTQNLVPNITATGRILYHAV